MASIRPKYSETVVHHQLGKTKVITGTDYYVVQEKARAQMIAWEMQWDKAEARREERETREYRREVERQEAAARKAREKKDKAQAKAEARADKEARLAREKQEKASYKQERLAEAQMLHEEAQARIAAVENILLHTLGVDDTVDWSNLKHDVVFTPPGSLLPPEKPSPLKLENLPDKLDLSQFDSPPPEPVNFRELPPKPVFSEKAYQPKLSRVAAIATSKQKKKEMAQAAWRKDWDEWQAQCKKIEALNLEIRTHALQKHQQEMQQLKDEAMQQWKTEALRVHRENAAREQAHQHAMQQWEQNCATYQKTYHAAQKRHERLACEHNMRIDRHKASYEAGYADATFDYFDLVLSQSQYPDSFNPSWEMQYQDDSKTLIVDYKLPHIEYMPAVKAVKYLVTKDEIREELLTEKQRQALYDSALYQIALRTVHELFESDYADGLHAVVFNGLVTSLDAATGNDVTACVMSLQASREEFLVINLAKVDPKACFRKLKGVGSSQLHSLAPVPPIMKLDTNDDRFVDAYGVAAGLDGATNLAEMHWEDFEHLVRELFEKEFQANGGEVKITRASSDGGVDAVAFDPDPIRGGKIVIQAKRYTNTVGVSAVRDLYGTTLNEGATKGILVSTANYGPDAIKFAKDKPLTLLNGANLLSLLQKHGHKAYIDTKEAKLKSKA